MATVAELPPSAPVRPKETPVLTIEGLAQRRVRNGVQEAWVGGPDLTLSSEFEPGYGWLSQCALVLEPGVRYRACAYSRQSASVHAARRSKDVIVRGERVEFYTVALPVTRWKWPGDRRIKLSNTLGLWTDGLMLSLQDGERVLKLNGVYKVIVERMA